jgi:ATP-dependent Clp protease ATP-binding subunit ClpX
LHELDEPALVDILTKPKNALVKQYQKLFEMDGVKLKFSQGALRAVAREALKRNAGARGLRAIMEKSMLDIMYEVPSQSDIREVAVSEEVIVSGEKPLIVYEKEEEKAELA